MKHVLFLVAFFTISVQCYGQENVVVQRDTPITIGKAITIQSNILGESRTINIYLPPGYSKDTSKKYPVIYLLDGSMDEDFIHIVGLVQFGSFPWIKMIPETIVVGIGNVDRQRDFTFPTHNAKDKKDVPTSGGSTRFIDFIGKELQPFIDKEYRTNSVKTIIGQSFGGLLATEILFKKPNLFDNYIIVSPSLWWDDESLLNVDPERDATKKAIYIGVGNEGEIMVGDAKRLYQKLQSTYKGNTRIFFKFFKKLNHGDDLHLAVYDAFEEIFHTGNNPD